MVVTGTAAAAAAMAARIEWRVETATLTDRTGVHCDNRNRIHV